MADELTELGPQCKCGDPACVVTRRKPDGTWRDYAGRRCSGRAVGRSFKGISAETKAGHRRWALDHWTARHDEIEIALRKFKAGKLDEFDMVQAIRDFGTREYRRGFGAGARTRELERRLSA